MLKASTNSDVEAMANAPSSPACMLDDGPTHIAP
jgi:hypothetical protein